MSTTTSESEQGPEGPRVPRLIRNEATTEIPVHLLFRPAEVGQAGPVGQVGSRRGTGVQPRVPRRETVVMPPVVDPELVECPARVLPGAVGVLAGGGGVAGCLVTAWWAGVLPSLARELTGLPAYAGAGLGAPQWAAFAVSGAVGLFGFGGLARGRTGCAWVLGLFGRYRGTVRRTGLMWVNPLLLRRRIDVRLRHWRSEPMPAVDAHGLALRVVVLVIWRVKDTARAALGVEDHERYLHECVEAALARLPADTEALRAKLTRSVAADVAMAGLQVFSVQPVRIEYAPEVAAVMQRRRLAALDAPLEGQA
ncbi:SPFH domain-containing protein [Streptomyces ureilyticus]|uniref:SPFH domain-containing protein n=1 Tax=Streptomyces ureilyticus TaxID=1775131 RepID=A0ABX0E250_9ACTN|nr:SPFH domain-containing protein [Streptomyces ureilyticus]NGO47808.1 SPFH domain-containing protein [Streptomyces ureilyticus]